MAISNIRRRIDLEKHLTIKNCDRTFLKNIIRFKKAKKLNKNRRRFDVNVTSLSSQKCVKTGFYKY